MKPGAEVRAIAAGVIATVLRGDSLDRAIDKPLTTLPLEDRALCRELCFGTLRCYPRLNAILEQLLNRPFRARDRDIEALALVGLYQLMEMRVPAHAAVSATVDAATVLRKRQTGGLLNALLRRYQREADTLLAALAPAATAAHPEWLWQALEQHWPSQREQIVAANNQRPPMTLRVNLARVSRESYRQQLQAAGIPAQPGTLSPAALRLDAPTDVSRLPGFGEGLCSVQDEAAQLAALLLDPQPGERVLDACAAPGGKTGHMLELQPALTSLLATDINAGRLQRVEDNLSRLQLHATLCAADGSQPSQLLRDAAPFDVILLDVPCSGTGVLRRHPDIKVLRRPEDAVGFAQQQHALLDGVWPLLADQGRLLYVTCSILPAENADVINAFLARQTNAEAQALTVGDAEPCATGLQLLPAETGSDGLYFAMLRKTRP
jgi:16S rRNA (cytosine967-C5)-methyltransferase